MTHLSPWSANAVASCPMQTGPLSSPRISSSKTMTLSSRESFRGCLCTWYPSDVHNAVFKNTFSEPSSRELPCRMCPGSILLVSDTVASPQTGFHLYGNRSVPRWENNRVNNLGRVGSVQGRPRTLHRKQTSIESFHGGCFRECLRQVLVIHETRMYALRKALPPKSSMDWN